MSTNGSTTTIVEADSGDLEDQFENVPFHDDLLKSPKLLDTSGNISCPCPNGAIILKAWHVARGKARDPSLAHHEKTGNMMPFTAALSFDEACKHIVSC